jgi:hypothetical protein
MNAENADAPEANPALVPNHHRQNQTIGVHRRLKILLLAELPQSVRLVAWNRAYY